VKKNREKLRTKITSKVSSKHKAKMKYLIKFIDPTNICSLLWPSTIKQRNYQILRSDFEQFRPVRILESLTRIGGHNDGGYLIPSVSLDFDGLISPGVGDSSKFELEFTQGRIQTVLIDASVTEPSNLPNHFIFLSKFLSATEGADFISINALVRDYFPRCRNLVLQMDIEGGEYEIFGNLSKSDLEPFGLILVEFHFLEKMRNSRGRDEVLGALELLNQGFILVHTHPNNAGGFFVDRYTKFPRVLETTWARKGSVNVQNGKSKLPHPLDEDNEPLIYQLDFLSKYGA
jgi:hypothetical protein